MKSECINSSVNHPRPAFAARSLALCRRALALTQGLKDRILSGFRGEREEQQHLVRLALNEAAALAWETDYPHLLFPALAAEKVQTVTDWQRHQQWIQQTEPRLAYSC
jgi:hypothetical protein